MRKISKKLYLNSMDCFMGSSSTDLLNIDIEADHLHVTRVEDAIKEGDVYVITMKMVAYGDRFLIDFGLDNIYKDIALRLAAENSTSSLGRNSRLKRCWGEEETNLDSNVSLPWNQNLEIQVFFTEESIFIALDGIHVAKYENRLPSNRIRVIEIRGNLTNIVVERSTITRYPLRRRNIPNVSEVLDDNAETTDVANVASSLPLPYYATFGEQSFKQGYCIVVTGAVPPEPTMFKVALQVGQSTWPQPIVAMQLEFRFLKKTDKKAEWPVLVFDTFTGGEWLGEHKSRSKVKLLPKSTFHLVIQRGDASYRISLSNEHLYDYSFFVNPLRVNTCRVDGDLKLRDVRLESN